MKVTDQGFTERVSTPATPASATVNSGTNRSSAGPTETSAGDDVQLSGFAARLNSGVAAESASRADRVNQIAKAVDSGDFRIDTAAVSRALVTEAVQGSH